MTHRNLLVVLAVLVLTTSAANAQRISPLIYDDPEFEWLDNRDPDSPRPSPNAFAGLQIGSTRVMVAYGSPAAKERKIFGGLGIRPDGTAAALVIAWETTTVRVSFEEAD